MHTGVASVGEIDEHVLQMFVFRAKETTDYTADFLAWLEVGIGVGIKSDMLLSLLLALLSFFRSNARVFYKIYKFLIFR